MSEEVLTKVHVDLPNNEDMGGESLWAESHGDNLYLLRNVPFYTYGLNFCDVVYAKSQFEELKPSVLKVHKSGGHRTLRVIFLDDSSAQDRMERLKELNQYKAYYENADGTLFAIDIEPNGDYGAVCDQLQKWEDNGLLSYETCEQRVDGRFDAGSS